jgi:low temperature requirement protein LtrA
MRAMLRVRGGGAPVTNAELFFDLVYVFAVTQLSHHLLHTPTLRGALQGLLLLVMIWLAWAYTTWTTNWLDPERLPVRATLLLTLLASLVMSVGLPEAFEHRGLLVAGAYVTMQVGRTLFVVFATSGDVLQRNFQRILTWSVTSGVFYVAGGFAEGHARELLWLIAVLIDLTGGAVGFYVPILGRSRTDEWTIEGGHFAERCQLFVMIALGESIVLIGSTLADLHPISSSQVVAFVGALGGSVALWWIYFDRSAADAAEVIAGSDDPGRLGRSAYHWVHPIMIAGIIVAAASDERVLAHPWQHGDRPTTWMVLGGVALFLIGHALFKAIVWRVVPWTRLTAAAVALIVLLVDPDVPALTLGIIALCLVTAVAAADRLLPQAAQASMLSQAVRSSSSTSEADGGPFDPAS